MITEYFEVEIIGTPSIQETQKHTEMKYVEIIDADNTLGFALKIDDIIIDDTYELATRFVAFHTIKNVLPHMQTYKEM